MKKERQSSEWVSIQELYGKNKRIVEILFVIQRASFLRGLIRWQTGNPGALEETQETGVTKH